MILAFWTIIRQMKRTHTTVGLIGQIQSNFSLFLNLIINTTNYNLYFTKSSLFMAKHCHFHKQNSIDCVFE